MSDIRPTASEIGALGGRARAENMTPEERSERARLAAEAKWGTGIPKAINTGELKIGDAIIPCAVLDDETRVLTQRGFSVALGRYKNPNRKGAIGDLPVFISANNLKPFIDEELVRSATQIRFRLAEGSGGLAGNIALGYRADLLPRVCNVYLKARQEGKLLKSQEHIADRCLILLNGLATVGIIALVDEATGFQDARARDALVKILEAYIAKELRPWVRTFEPDFYKEMFRLRNLPYNGSCKRPQYIGRLTNDIVYARLAPGVLEQLKRKNPVDDQGRRKDKHHQWLTPDHGHPELKAHLKALTTLMRVFDTWEPFYSALQRALPKQIQMPLFEWPESRSDDESEETV